MKFGVCLNTQSAGMMREWMKKPIAAGSLFMGKFQIDYVLTDALKSTRFGVPNSKEPVRITGWYKYQPGEKFTDMDMNVYPDRKDEASIYAVYYRNTDDKGECNSVSYPVTCPPGMQQPDASAILRARGL